MILLIDENVPESVSQVFRDHGHDVYLVRDRVGGGTPDPVVARVGNTLGAILVTWNVRDFQRLAARRQSDQLHVHRLGRVNFKCLESRGAMRAEQMMSRIEFEYAEAQRRPDKRVIVTITETTFSATV